MALFGKKKDNSANSGMMGGDPNIGMPPGNADPYMTPDPYQSPDPMGGNMPPDMNAMPPDMGGNMPPDMNAMPPDMGGMPPPDMGALGGDQYGAPSEQFEDPKERIEEITEAIIDEKWSVLVKDINKVVEWKEKMDNQIKKFEGELSSLKDRFEALHRGVLGKITEYDQNLTTVGSEIKAMEMAFQKILPSFTENIHKLDRIVKGGGK